MQMLANELTSNPLPFETSLVIDVYRLIWERLCLKILYRALHGLEVSL